MIDIESLGLGPDCVITQAAFMAVPMDDTETRLAYDSFHLPIQPQLDAGRSALGATLIWWMQQDDKARKEFDKNDGDSDALIAFVRSFIRKIKQVIDEVPDYEIWARGPQFDVVALESLFKMCGESAPWEYNKVRDLRTLTELAKVQKGDVDESDIVKHIALEDCRLQIRYYDAAMRSLKNIG